MPEPIIEPMTIIVASISPSSRTSFGDGCGLGLASSGSAPVARGRSRIGRTSEVELRLLCDERLDVGDRLLDRVAPPVGQGAVEGPGEVVGQMGGGGRGRSRPRRGSRGSRDGGHAWRAPSARSSRSLGLVGGHEM